MSVKNKTKENGSLGKKILNLIKTNLLFFIILVSIIVLDGLVIAYRPALPGFEPLKSTFFLFGLSLQAIVLIYAIGFFLLYRWFKTGRKVESTLLWAIAFLCYGFVFIGLLLQSLGFAWANSNVPSLFFAYRNVMIIWVSLMYIGIAQVLTNSRKIQLIPAIIFIILGYIWFVVGLFGLADIEYTMYVFLYTLWTPLCVTITYCFVLYGREARLASPKIIAIGFGLLGVTYLAWSPWHLPDVSYIYLIWFSIFNISLVFILLGYALLPYETAAKLKNK